MIPHCDEKLLLEGRLLVASGRNDRPLLLPIAPLTVLHSASSGKRSSQEAVALTRKGVSPSNATLPSTDAKHASAPDATLTLLHGQDGARRSGNTWLAFGRGRCGWQEMFSKPLFAAGFWCSHGSNSKEVLAETPLWYMPLIAGIPVPLALIAELGGAKRHEKRQLLRTPAASSNTYCCWYIFPGRKVRHNRRLFHQIQNPKAACAFKNTCIPHTMPQSRESVVVVPYSEKCVSANARGLLLYLCCQLQSSETRKQDRSQNTPHAYVRTSTDASRSRAKWGVSPSHP